MGRKCKTPVITIEHLTSKIKIKQAKCCSNCPIKIYCKDDETITFGTGNIFTNTIMVLPSYDFKADIGYPTILKIIQDCYKEITTKDILEDYYITRTIKCLNKTNFNLEKDAIKYCINHLFYEVFRLKPKKVIIFDKEIYDFGLYNCNRGKFIVKTVISPAIMYYNNQNLKDIFMKQLKEAINDS